MFSLKPNFRVKTFGSNAKHYKNILISLGSIIIKMESSNVFDRYVAGKLGQWKSIQGYRSADHYIHSMGRGKIASEISGDATSFCLYLRGATYDQIRSHVLKLVEWTAGLLFGFPMVGGIDIFLSAMMEVCGYRKLAGKIVESAI